MPKIPRFSPKQAPTMVLSTTYGKPLQRGLVQAVETSRMLVLYQKELLKKLRAGILQATFSDAARRRLSKSIQVKISGNRIRVTTRDPAWRPLVDGQKAGAMKWLVKARAPIPIVTDTGKVIFRTATAKSLANGKWVHPGRPRQNIVEKAKEEARKGLKKKLQAEVARQLRAVLQ